MALILFPKTSTQKPEIPQINWGSRQADGLIFWQPIVPVPGGLGIGVSPLGYNHLTSRGSAVTLSASELGTVANLGNSVANGYLQASGVTRIPNINSENYTVSCWVYFHSVATTQGIFSSGNTGFGLALRAAVLRMENVANGTLICSSGVTAVANRWYHLLFTHSSTVGPNWIYVDGIQRATSATSSPAIAPTVAEMGRNTDGFDPHNGLGCDYRIYNQWMSPAEVSAMYANPWALWGPQAPAKRMWVATTAAPATSVKDLISMGFIPFAR